MVCRRARLSGLAAGALAVALVAGCTGGEPAPSTSTPAGATSASSSTTSSAPSSSTSSSAAYVPVKPAFPAAAKKHTQKGALAFVAYYWDALNYAMTKPDADILTPLFEQGCEGCAELQDAAKALVKAGERFSGPVAKLEESTWVVEVDGMVRVLSESRVLEAKRIAADGTASNVRPPRNIRRSFDLVWRSGKWWIHATDT